MTVTRAAIASKTPQLDRNQVGFAGDGTIAPDVPDITSIVAMSISPSLAAAIEIAVDQVWGTDHLSQIN
jgi:hypothetical protein